MKRLLVVALLFCSIVVTGCASPSAESSDTTEPSVSATSETKTVQDMKGSVDIPANPQRIVDVSGSADELIALDIPFVGSANTSMFDGVSVPDYLQETFTSNNVEIVGNYSGSMDLNLEKIAELKPDLIIMNIRHEKVYDQLKQIAPTVMIDDDMDYIDWRGRFEQLGEWFDKEDAVAQWLQDFDEKSADLSQEIKAVTGDDTFAVVEANSVHFGSYYVYRDAGPGEIVFDELGLAPSAGVPENIWGEVVDAEYFSQIDADHVFFFSDDGTVGDLTDTPTWTNLKAVQNGNVYLGLNETQYNMAYTPNGKLLYMEKLADAVINHTNVA